MIETVSFISMGILILAVLISFLRLLKSKRLPDKIVALNHIGVINVGLLLNFIILSEKTVYMDVGLAFILISFTGTIMIAKYLKRKRYES